MSTSTEHTTHSPFPTVGEENTFLSTTANAVSVGGCREYVTPTPYYSFISMSRTYRKQPTYIFRPVQTFNEQKQVLVSKNFYDDEYDVKIRHRYIPSLYDDIHVSAYKQLDHHH